MILGVSQIPYTFLTFFFFLYFLFLLPFFQLNNKKQGLGASYSDVSYDTPILCVDTPIFCALHISTTQNSN